MKSLSKIIIIFIFSLNFIACEKTSHNTIENPTQEPAKQIAKQLTEQPINNITQEEIELGQKISKAVKSENWEELDSILNSIPDEPEQLPKILEIIDKGNLEEFKKQVKQIDEYIYIKTAYNECVTENFDLSITPLGYASQKNKIEIVRFLLENKVNIEKGIYNKVAEKDLEETKSPLFLAVSNKNKEIAKLLIEAGADVNFVYDEIGGDCENESSSVLMEAIKWGDKDIINALILQDADVNKIVWQGDSRVSALDFAEDKEIKQILINAGAKYSKDLK